jgi:hypothetical protein
MHIGLEEENGWRVGFANRDDDQEDGGDYSPTRERAVRLAHCEELPSHGH